MDYEERHQSDIILKTEKQNFNYVLSYWTKNKILMIFKTGFIAYWKKKDLMPIAQPCRIVRIFGSQTKLFWWL